jgi:macrolide-specific efflux system membrane fusion protein
MNVTMLPLLISLVAVGGQQQPILLESVQITLVDEVELAAREAGQIVALPVHEGQIVSAGELIARIDDTEPQLLRKRSQVEASIAERQASNDVKVRFAKKSREVADAELRRARESVDKFRKSVSDTELDRLRLAAERTLLEIEQAEQDQQIAALTHQLKNTEVAVAEQSIERRKVLSPLDAMVVELKRRVGEWVQPGDVVARLVRVDRVRAEGFLPAGSVTPNLLGSPALLTLEASSKGSDRIEGRIAFVSPEVNPVNNLVRVWAEFENADGALRPGLKGKLTIQPASK